MLRGANGAELTIVHTYEHTDGSSNLKRLLRATKNCYVQEHELHIVYLVFCIMAIFNIDTSLLRL